MPENTITAPLAPMEPDGVAAAFVYIRAMHAGDIPIAAVHDRAGEPCELSFLAAALGWLLELLYHSVCLASARGIADTIVRFTEDHGDVGEVLRRPEAAGMKQAMEAHPATA
ncbi:hypothetical protein [Streptomyces cinereoruber]|uniref:hypothetical protein n=1 Tax=Streptomyces cinereoruber TaxID=67260 RepID=UPI003627A681